MVDTFPTFPGIGFPVRRKPQFTTLRYEALSGRRTYAPKQTFPRWRWELPFNILRSAAYDGGAFTELEDLVGFFNAQSSTGDIFAYEDPEDNTATEQGFGAGDGTSVDFQLYRTYGGFVEPVYSASPDEIKVNGVPTVDYTVSQTGVVTFGVAPADGNPLVWSGTFKWLCRFDKDQLDIEMILKGLWDGDDALSFSSELNP